MFLQGFSKSQGFEEILQFRPIVLLKQVGISKNNDGLVVVVVEVVEVDVVVVEVVDEVVVVVVVEVVVVGVGVGSK